MRAIVLAGGKGRRLAPYTITFPKPLIPVDDMPILEIVVRQLKGAGFERITLAVGHLAELLMAYFGDGRRWGIQIDYSRESRSLGTVGPLALVEDLPETFLVMNGDVLTTLKYAELFEHHVASKAELTIACHRCSAQVDYGTIEFDSQLNITGYREKPTLHYDVSMGVYVFNRSVVEMFEPGDRIDLPDLAAMMIDRGTPPKVFPSNDEWLDIGRPDDYARAIDLFLAQREQFLPPAGAPRPAASHLS